MAEAPAQNSQEQRPMTPDGLVSYYAEWMQRIRDEISGNKEALQAIPERAREAQINIAVVTRFQQEFALGGQGTVPHDALDIVSRAAQTANGDPEKFKEALQPQKQAVFDSIKGRSEAIYAAAMAQDRVIDQSLDKATPESVRRGEMLPGSDFSPDVGGPTGSPPSGNPPQGSGSPPLQPQPPAKEAELTEAQFKEGIQKYHKDLLSKNTDANGAINYDALNKQVDKMVTDGLLDTDGGEKFKTALKTHGSDSAGFAAELAQDKDEFKKFLLLDNQNRLSNSDIVSKLDDLGPFGIILALVAAFTGKGPKFDLDALFNGEIKIQGAEPKAQTVADNAQETKSPTQEEEQKPAPEPDEPEKPFTGETKIAAPAPDQSAPYQQGPEGTPFTAVVVGVEQAGPPRFTFNDLDDPKGGFDLSGLFAGHAQATNFMLVNPAAVSPSAENQNTADLTNPSFLTMKT